MGLVAASFLLALIFASLSAAQFLTRKNLCGNICYCTNDTFDCTQERGKQPLEQIPVDIPQKYKTLIINFAKFPTNVLRHQDISSLQHLQTLKIVYSNLRYIEPYTFSKMKNLRELDLSHNQITRIDSGTFSGLNLTVLILSDNYQLSLDEEAFRDLRAEKIILRNNGLNELSIAPFELVADLHRLTLYNNNITDLSPEVKRFFDVDSRILDLTSNPLTCKCDLSWLAIRALPWSRIDPHIKIQCNYAEKNNYGSLTGRLLQVDLIEMIPDKLCSRTSISSIDIDIQQGGRNAVLTCKATSAPDLGMLQVLHRRSTSPSESQFNLEQLIHVQAPLVTWNYEIDNDQFTRRSTNNIANGPISTSKVDLNIDLVREARNYTCEARGENESRQRVVINLKGFKPPETKPVTTTTTTTTLTPMVVVENEAQKNGFTEHHFLFRKQFTLFEMIGAIIGTFILTLIFLLVCSRCHYVLCRRKSSWSRHGSSIHTLRDCKALVGKVATDGDLLNDSSGALVTASTRTGCHNSGSTNSSGASLNPAGGGPPPFNYSLPPGTPGPQYLPASFIQTLSLQQHQGLFNQHTPMMQGTLREAALIAAGHWPGGPPPPGSPYSMNSHEYDVPRNSDFNPFEQQSSELRKNAL